MQAIILAAGMGKRLKELTKDNTKCMLKVNGVTLIERLLHQLDSLHLSKIILVVGYKSENLIEYINGLDVKTPIKFINNPIYDKTNNIYSLYLAKESLKAEDTLLFESDLIVEDSIISKILNNPYPDLALVAKFESWMDGTVVTIDEENNIVRFIPNKSFRFEEILSYHKTVNIYKFSRDFSANMYVPFLEAYCAALGKNEYYEQVLRVLTLLDKPGIKALPLNNEHWYEIDDIQDLDIAESIFANSEESLQKISARYGGYWRYPDMLDFCYLVNPYFPSSKLTAEIKANFERLMCEYPSGLNVNNLLAAKNFDINQNYICVGNGAAELIKSITSLLKGIFGVIYPTFEEYPNRLDKERIVSFSPGNSCFSYNENDIINYFSSKKIDNLVIINPDNPSGNFISKTGLEKLCEWSKNQAITLIIDESFIDFAESGKETTLITDEILEKYPDLIIVKSISKSYGVPGLRLGIIASGNTNFISQVKRDIAIWNINSFAEFYLQIYGKYQDDYRQACLDFVEERGRFKQDLEKISFLRVIPSQANYFLCEITGKYTSSLLTKILLEKYRILIKDCFSKTGNRNFVRIAVRNTKDNNKIIEALTDLQ